jgi:predicted lipoprotein with Yx(FWY)xxD motif
MKNAIALAVTTAAVVLIAGAAVAGATPAGGSATVTTARTSLGPVVADAQGRTLYLFAKDTAIRSRCTGTCAVYWPPLLTGPGAVAVKGVQRSLIGTIKRPDGTRQVTFAGHPLYRFSGDAGRGQTNGEGLQDFGASWYVLSPGGKKIVRA